MLPYFDRAPKPQKTEDDDMFCHLRYNLKDLKEKRSSRGKFPDLFSSV